MEATTEATTTQTVAQISKPIEQREYQSRIIAKTLDAFQKEKCKSVLIESPTGSGKTLMTLMALKQMEEQDAEIKFGWVAMRRKLLKQAQRENERVGVKNISFVSMFERNPPEADLMITDECQHDAASTCATMHKLMNAKLSLGLTATPFRTDRVKLAYEKIISDCGIRFLVDQGYLSAFHHYAIPEWSPETIATCFLADPKRWGKSVIYLETRALCYEVQRLLQAGGVSAEVILGDTNLERQDEIYTGFENGQIQVLINVYLLTEGFDAPDLRTVWVRPTGKLCTMQMAGRVLRKWSDLPFKNVVQPDKPRPGRRPHWPFTRTAKAQKEFIWTPSGEWLGLEPGQMVDTVSNMIRNAVLSKMEVRLSPFLLGRGGKARIVGKKGKTQVKFSENSGRPGPRADNPIGILLGYREFDEDALDDLFDNGDN